MVGGTAGPASAKGLDIEALFDLLPSRLQDQLTDNYVSSAEGIPHEHNNQIHVGPDILDEAFDNAFFNPARPTTKKDSRSPSSGLINVAFDYPLAKEAHQTFDILGGTPASRQFYQFEQSYFRLDKMLGMRRLKNPAETAESSSSSQKAAVVLTVEALNQSLPKGSRAYPKPTGVLEPVVTSKAPSAASQPKLTVAQLRALTIGSILKKAMLVDPQRAAQIEAECKPTAKPMALEATETTKSASAVTKDFYLDSPMRFETFVRNLAWALPLFDQDSLWLLDQRFLPLYAQILRLKFHPHCSQRYLVHQVVARVRLALQVGRPKDQLDLTHYIQEITAPSKPKAEIIPPCKDTKDDAGFVWTGEADSQLVCTVDTLRRRKAQLEARITAYLQSGLDPDLQDRIVAQCDVTDRSKRSNGGFWFRVSRELRRSLGNQTITDAVCKSRWIQLCSSRM